MILAMFVHMLAIRIPDMFEKKVEIIEQLIEMAWASFENHNLQLTWDHKQKQDSDAWMQNWERRSNKSVAYFNVLQLGQNGNA